VVYAQAAMRELSGRHTWLEAGIIDPSVGDGPMVPSAETDRGDSCRRRRDDGRPRVVSPTAHPTSSSSAGAARYGKLHLPGLVDTHSGSKNRY
jgi:hypothetical protein